MVSAQYEFKILGPLEVRRDGQPVRIGAAKVRLLLAALLAEANQVVTVETLVNRLWGEKPPSRARNTLQNYVLRLRRALDCPAGGAPVHTRPHGYVIETAPDTLDLHRFAALVRQGRTALEEGAAARAAPLLREALGLWRGAPLSDLPAHLLQGVVPALDERRLDAMELRIDADLALGRAADVLPELRGLIEEHPLREHFWAQRMLALFRCGRQGEALECYRVVTALLAEELGVAPGAGLRQLHQRLLAAAPDLDEVRRGKTARLAREGDLPVEMTTFVGREAQLAQVRALLGSARLVTLTGVGGVGKTRLALRAAADIASSFADGVRLADLAPLSDADLLDRAVSEALGLRDQSARPAADTVVGHLRDRRLLLVLDNCEHLVEPVAALVLRLARAAPGLRVLATSRQRLGVPGEHVLTVPSLTLPGADVHANGTVCPEVEAEAGADDPLSRFEAVRLLVDRASGSAPAFRLTARNRAAVAQLCRRLDGIPLAIELAAVRLSAITAEEMLERLDDRFRLLSVPQMRTSTRYRQTLRGVVDWSYDLCTEGERLLWNRLSVFSGGFDLEAAESVCAGEGVAREDVLNVLAGLVDKSIVVVNSSGDRARYIMLETIRQYGQQRLDETGCTVRLRVRHSEYYRATAVRAGREWCGPREVDWLIRLRTELPNLRAALDYCATRQDRVGAGVEIAVNLARTRCWFFSSTLGEGRHWLERLLGPGPDGPHALAGPNSADAAVAGAPALVAGALAMKAWIALCQGDNPAAETFLAECRAVAHDLPDGASAAPVTYIEGAHAMLVRGDPSSVALLGEARERFHAVGQGGDAHMATMLWAMAEAFFGTGTSARAVRDVYVAEAEASGAEWARTWAQWCTGLVELRHGEAEGALAPLREALARQRSIGDSWGPVWGLETLAWAVAATGDCTRAAWLLGAAHRMRQETGVALIGLRPFHEAHLTAERRVRASLGAEEYTAGWSRGASAEDGLRLALDEGEFRV
ncbi:BTAD domain-containing putative transcriptional regulator [Streptomyces sp. NL15-2K]|uniref:BTAD domain-containing putative transcriptional regulator n=1 Tax=Streptomyces sp. NL15-2K TaxID=376149 RepID=UPI000FFAD8A5|nr:MULTISPECIES: BTAD domain-containing putative transcriptional regulator [Actinomycetes]WKX13241.1 BTAD domain-containing putative transcriptional regulator [Kutzneria buriramensis]GCB45401.1 signal transduction response regulator [Streptomyces sp. NL15-2K]